MRRWRIRIFKSFGFGVLALGLIACGLHVKNGGTSSLPPLGPQSLRVATYNVHYIVLRDKTGPWSIGDWDRRKRPLDLAFKMINPDIIGFQEMESFAGGDESTTNLALDYLLENNPGYAAAAVGDPDEFPITQPFLYRRDRLTQTDQGWFFFSTTPDVIYSRTFNGSWPAFCSWATFADKVTGEIITVFNVHFEYRSRSNRQLSAALVRDRIAPRVAAGQNVILLGDINARQGATTQNILASAGLNFTPVRGSTYHLNAGINLFDAIDHVALSPDLSAVRDPIVIRQKFDGEWPTDHYPVVVDVNLRHAP